MVYDTLIRGAQILDGSGSAPRYADVAIKGHYIALITDGPTAPANNTINADGLCLAPGFIDVHTHDDMNAISAPDMLPKISQGVTTVIVGNCGISASPVSLRAAPPDPLNLLGKFDDFIYPEFSDFAKAIEAARPSVNVGALVGHTAIRSNHMDNLQRSATADEIAAMKLQLRSALKQGALGLSSGLAYGSANCATTEEVMALVEEVGRNGGVYTTHLRTEFDGILEAMNEAFATARHGKASLVISHLKCAGAGNWGRSTAVLNHLDAAANSQQVACDCYPYSASSSTLDLAQVTDKSDIFITWSESHPEQAGRLLKNIAEQWQLSLVETAKKLQPAGAVYHCMDEQDVRTILRHERSMIGSDGLPNDPHPHPRLWGSFPRVIGHYCRDLGVLELPSAIHKMTGLSAEQFKLHKRGIIAEGNFADLVLFNPDTVRDTATYENPKQIAKGIEKVWVNGCLSYIAGGAAQGRAGQFLYGNCV
mgnify:CR=1 FL=1